MDIPAINTAPVKSNRNSKKYTAQTYSLHYIPFIATGSVSTSYSVPYCHIALIEMQYHITHLISECQSYMFRHQKGCSVFISAISDNHAGEAAVVFGMLPTSQPTYFLILPS